MTVELKSNNPLVSIIIPCYNYGRYLGEAIESGLNQTYQPIEVIVVNDGSTDNTVEVANRYPIKLIDRVHQGASAAFNQGIWSSRGEYLVKLDADDILNLSYVEKTLKVLRENPEIAFVYAYATIFGNTSGTAIAPEYDIKLLKRGNLHPGTALTKKSAFLATDGFDPALECLEDWDICLSLAGKNLYGKLLPEPLLLWRWHKSGRHLQSLVKVTSVFRRILRKHSTLYQPLEMELIDKHSLYCYLKERLLPARTCRRMDYDWLASQIKRWMRCL